MEKSRQLEQIKQRITDELFDDLRKNSTNMVFGKGNADASIMFIGEAPGEQEDKQGIPFVGAAGRELDKLLRMIGLTLEDVYIANILKYRPPNNRNPQVDEIKAHTPYLVEQIKIIQPAVICTLGNFSTKFVLAKFDIDGMQKIQGISKLHGQIEKITINGFTFTVIPLYHPAAMLYKPPLRAVLEEDIKAVGAFLGRPKLPDEPSLKQWM